MRLLAVAMLCFFGAGPSRAAEVVYNTAGQGESLLKRETSARIAALGGNGASLNAGVDSLYSNPAALSQLATMELGLHHQSWLADINQESANLAAPSHWGSWGLGLGWVNYGNFDAVDELGQSKGTVSAQDYSFDLAWARAVGAGLSVGGAARYIQEMLAGDILSQSSLDLGILWAWQRWQIGVLFANVAATALGGDRGPSSLRGEISGDLMARPGQLHCNVGFSAEPNGLSRIQAGIESQIYPLLSARVGYEARLGSTLLQGFSGATFGAGFRLGPADLDYAFLPFGDLGSGHRLSLRWRFKAAATPTPSPTPLPAPSPLPTAKPLLVPPPLPAPQPLVVAPPLLIEPTATSTPTPPPTQLQFKVTEDSLENARRLEDAGHVEEAVAVHQRLLLLYPHNPRVWRSLGDLQYRAGRHGDALQSYDKAFDNGLIDDDLENWLAKVRSQP